MMTQARKGVSLLFLSVGLLTAHCRLPPPTADETVTDVILAARRCGHCLVLLSDLFYDPFFLGCSSLSVLPREQLTNYDVQQTTDLHVTWLEDVCVVVLCYCV